MASTSTNILTIAAALILAPGAGAAGPTPGPQSPAPHRQGARGATDAPSRPVLPPNARPFGQGLAEWSEDYWRWFLTGGSAATEPFQPGPAPIVFMPQPQGAPVGGSGTSEDPVYLLGSMEITIRAGTSFVLPSFAWIAEQYNTGQPDDPTIPNEFIGEVATNLDRSGAPEWTLDGRPILENFWDHYVGPLAFEPVVVYPAPTPYGSVAAHSFQGVGFIAGPLTPGTHELHLLERLTLTNDLYPGYAFPIDLGIVYDNTWIIHVER